MGAAPTKIGLAGVGAPQLGLPQLAETDSTLPMDVSGGPPRQDELMPCHPILVYPFRTSGMTGIKERTWRRRE